MAWRSLSGKQILINFWWVLIIQSQSAAMVVEVVLHLGARHSAVLVLELARGRYRPEIHKIAHVIHKILFNGGF